MIITEILVVVVVVAVVAAVPPDVIDSVAMY